MPGRHASAALRASTPPATIAGQVVSGLMGEQIGTKFPVIPLPQDLCTEMTGPRQLLHVAPISVSVPPQLCKGKIVGLQRMQSLPLPVAGKQRRHSLPVILGRRGYRNSVEVNVVFPMKGRSFTRNLGQMTRYIRNHAEEINIAGGARDAVILRHNKASAAVQIDLLLQERVNVCKKRAPGLGGFEIIRHRAAARLSESLRDANTRRLPGNAF